MKHLQDRHVVVHVSFANVIEYAKAMMQKDLPDISRVNVTYLLAQNTIIDDRTILIKIPKKLDASKQLKDKIKLSNLFI